MEILVILTLLGGVLVVLPLVAIAALVRATRLKREVATLRDELHGLNVRVESLGRRVAAGGGVGAPRGDVAPAPAPATTPSPAAPPPPPAPPRPEPTPPTETVPPARQAPPIATPVSERPVPRPSAPPPASTPPPRRPAEASPPGPGFDWESLLGLKGAAWLGGATLVMASLFFAKWAVDQGLFTPPLRVASLIAAGLAGLIWAELSLRRGFRTTANAVSGAGIAVLYVAFFAGHSLYGLFPLVLTFGLMALVTVLAGVLAIRYDAYVTAVLGLLGGFATPIALSTGVDRPVGLFSYILLLNVGLIAVALKRRWHGLVLLGLAGTFVIELGWYGRFMAPHKMVVGLTAFLVFGLLYLLLPLAARDDAESPRLLQVGAVGGTLPFLFAMLLAGDRRFATEWPLLFGYVGLLDAALVAVAVLRGRVTLLVSAALATAVMLPLWATQGLVRDSVWGPTLGAIALAWLLNASSRMAARRAPKTLEASSTLFEAAGLLGLAGLGLFGLVLVVRGFGDPPWPFLTLLAGALVAVVERSEPRRLRYAHFASAVALATLVQIWFFRLPADASLLRNLAVGLLLSIALGLLAMLREAEEVGRSEDGAAVVGANGVYLLGLFGCLASTARGADPLPLFAALAVVVVLFLASAVRRDWTPLVPFALASVALYALIWQEAYFHAQDLGVVVPVYGVFFVAFLALPFVVPAPVRTRWRERPLVWFSSALSGPALFLPLWQATSRGWGDGWIGLLPLAQAALTVAALRGVAERFGVSREAAAADSLRLRYLALFAAVALGFVAVAIPLQLDRQWITIGWALEAAAVWWLFGRLPHTGLRTFGAVLFAGVGVRLLLNEEVLHYQPRGLPILNWLLYSYGVPALCCFAGARFLRAAGDRTRLAPAAAFLGLLLVFWLINLEVVDFFSTGPYVELTMERQLGRDLTLSLAWGLYAMALLLGGIVKGVPALRWVSLGFLVLTVGKVFFYDLANLTGIHRILSFLGLGIALIAVSLLYQRFVLSRRSE